MIRSTVVSTIVSRVSLIVSVIVSINDLLTVCRCQCVLGSHEAHMLACSVGRMLVECPMAYRMP